MDTYQAAYSAAKQVSPDVAEDIAQEAAMLSLRKRINRSWACMYGRSKALSHRTTQSRRKKIERNLAYMRKGESQCPSKTAELQELCDMVNQAVDQLPAELRQLALCSADNYTNEELCYIFNVSITTIYRRMSKVRKKLRHLEELLND